MDCPLIAWLYLLLSEVTSLGGALLLRLALGTTAPSSVLIVTSLPAYAQHVMGGTHEWVTGRFPSGSADTTACLFPLYPGAAHWSFHLCPQPSAQSLPRGSPHTIDSENTYTARRSCRGRVTALRPTAPLQAGTSITPSLLRAQCLTPVFNSLTPPRQTHISAIFSLLPASPSLPTMPAVLAVGGQ